MQILFRDLSISSVAASIPSNELHLESLSHLYGEEEVRAIIKSTKIEKIRVADEKTTAADLCEAAAVNLMKSLNIKAADFDALIFVSQTPDYKIPATSFLLQNKLGLSTQTACFDLPYGCSGYIYGLLQAALLINSGCCTRALLLAGDTTTKMINQMDRSTRMVFGDAGTATVVEKGGTTIGFNLLADGSGAKQIIIPTGGYRTPANEKSSISRQYEDGYIRSDEDIYMDGMGVFNFAISEMPVVVNKTLADAGWTKDEVGTFAFHQANGFILDYLRKKMKLSKEQVPSNIESYGNTGPASIPLLLSETGNARKTSNQLNKTILSGYGVGLSWGAAFVDLSQTEFLSPVDY